MAHIVVRNRPTFRERVREVWEQLWLGQGKPVPPLPKGKDMRLLRTYVAELEWSMNHKKDFIEGWHSLLKE